MSLEVSVVEGAGGRHRVLTAAVRARLREVRGRLSVLHHVVSGRLSLRDVDLDCLDLVARLGPVGPGELARRTGVHPATMTGVLDRLQRAGWVVRERDPGAADRRGVVVRVRRERAAEVWRLYAGMRTALDGICAGYTEAELELLADFLGRVAAAGGTAIDDLVADGATDG